MCNGKTVFVNAKIKQLVHNVKPYKSEIMHAKSSKPSRMFQCDAVDTNPDLGAKMSSNPSKWLFDIKRRT